MINFYKIKFIHIGKCAGTTIVDIFKLDEIHLEKPVFNNNTYYIIWIRNPISRFVSAFYFAYQIIKIDVSKLDIDNLSLNNCIAPLRLKHKAKNNNIAFDPKYEELLKYFKTPNNLAESLSSSDESIKLKALELMHRNEEHIYKGIGWYLDNGDFINKYHANILFVGKVETMTNDIYKLCKLLNVNPPNEIKKIRQNNHDNNLELSDTAIANIINFYKNTDYNALIQLENYGFINKNDLNTYYKYNAIFS